jgi:hypothetical protein
MDITLKHSGMSPQAKAAGGNRFLLLAKTIGERMLPHPGQDRSDGSFVDCNASTLAAASATHPQARQVARATARMVASSRLAASIFQGTVGHVVLAEESSAVVAARINVTVTGALISTLLPSAYQAATEHARRPAGEARLG